MSSVSLPAAAPGRLVAEVVLATPEDKQLLLDKLKGALAQLQSGKWTPPARAAAGVPAAAAGPPAAPAPAPQPVAPAPPARQAPPRPAAAPAAAPPLFPGAIPAASAASTSAASYASMPAAVPPIVAAPPVQPRPALAPAPVAPPTAGPSPAAAAAPTSGWQCCWTTDAADHSSDPVTSMAYLPSVQGLPGGEGHAGWLVSASRGLLNLWEASPSGGRGEAALMCMHSQGTDYTSVCLDAERGTRMLLASSVDGSGSEWVTAHSLEVETLLAPKGRCPMPHSAQAKISGQNCLAVTSLHGFGGPLAETCVASYGGALVCWSVGNATRPAMANNAVAGQVAPKALWKAHNALITVLHRSAFGLSLFSGAADGKIHMFNMREKPSKPNLEFQQQGRITGIAQINDSQLVTTAGDGRLMVWDLRSAAAGPVSFAVPDTRPIVRMALSPFADSVALATTAGLYSVDLLDSACQATRITTAPLKSPVTALTWNTATSEVVVAGGTGPQGSISVFKHRLGF